jgi:CheY-like chemotaxis protein
MAERRLLLIDDDKTIHAVVRATLAPHGFQVHSAFDSVQAAGAAATRAGARAYSRIADGRPPAQALAPGADSRRRPRCSASWLTSRPTRRASWRRLAAHVEESAPDREHGLALIERLEAEFDAYRRALDEVLGGLRTA